ncbi:hypothetical protein AVO45_17280 [Ruegeria marisrubri]|uniref:Carnitine dehydratase n=1 Tax=Ruegeria marisrubri TaxID=1685379 RepID=A0A0X3UAX7_9RHOB|nr:CaiB/BaiF CoA-transferase family protein [Ruegeria marisrubri]KUJ85255.1 hypothetical protein AVO45_17280 [Ruegeria marisrubri]
MRKILEGIKVVEVAAMAAGPSAGVILADFGAEVVKIEPPSGDPWRNGHLLPGMPKSETPYTTFIHNRTKKSVALNLKKPEAQEVLNKMVETADVFLTNSPIRVAEELNHAYEDIRAINPRIIYASVNGFGYNGPDRHNPGFDMTSWFAETGLMEEFRPQDSEPARQPVGLGDMNTATSLYAAIATALFHRERTGEGTKVSTSLLENGIWSNASMVQPALVNAPPMKKYKAEEWPNPLAGAFYRTRDGRYVIIVELNPANFSKLAKALDAGHLTEDPRFASPQLWMKYNAELIAEIQKLIGELDTDEVVARFRAAGTNFGLCKRTSEVVSDENAIANGCFPEVVGTDGIRTVANPLHIEGVETVPPQLPPVVGQDSAEQLMALGYSDAEIAALVETGAVALAR